MRYLLSILSLLLASTACAAPNVLILNVGSPQVSSLCPETPFFEQTAYNNAFNIGSTTGLYRAGIVNTSSTPLAFSKIGLYSQEYGSLTGKTMYVERWTVNSSTNDLVAKQEDVTSFDPTIAESSLGWISVCLNKTVSLAQNEAIVFSMNAAIDSGNYFRIAFQGANIVANQYADNWDSSGVNSSIVRDMAVRLY